MSLSLVRSHDSSCTDKTLLRGYWSSDWNRDRVIFLLFAPSARPFALFLQTTFAAVFAILSFSVAERMFVVLLYVNLRRSSFRRRRFYHRSLQKVIPQRIRPITGTMPNQSTV